MNLRSLFILALLLSPLPALAAGIAVVVNDDAITTADVDNRMALLMLSSGLSKDEETMKRLKERVLKNLIDEKLQTQEAKRYSIEVEREEIDRAVGVVAKNNRLEPDELLEAFGKAGVPKSTLEDQIRATLSWTKVIQRVLRPQVEVGDDEVSAVLERIKANEGKPEYLISEIFIGVENPQDEAKNKELADSLITRLKEGTPFSALAQQFSQSTSAINGGELGWVQPGQLPGALDETAKNLGVGNISEPIRMPDGFYILGKKNERIISAANPDDIAVRMKQASIDLAGRSAAQMQEEINRFKQTISSCGTLTTRGEQFPEWRISDLGEKRMAELPRWLSDYAKKAPLNQPGETLEKNGHAILLYVCERNDSGSDRSAIIASIGNEKLELQARRLLRDLHRSASIENRNN